MPNQWRQILIPSYLPALAREVAQVTLLLPVADEGSVAGPASELVECCVNHDDWIGLLLVGVGLLKSAARSVPASVQIQLKL